VFDNENLYCKVFVKGPSDGAALIKIIAAAVEGIAESAYIHGQESEIVVMTNDAADSSRASHKAANSFLFFPVFLDVEARDERRRKEYVAELSGLISRLRSLNYTVVPACSFEDELN
jgi:hypothetical protein